MGVLPLQYPAGQTAASLGPDRHRDVHDHRRRRAQRRLNAADGTGHRRRDVAFDAVVRIDTPGEADYYRHGGILQYVLRKMLES